MTDSDPLRAGIDSVAGRTGLGRDAVAILAIVAGIIVLVFPRILEIVIGILLIVVGVVWLVNSYQDRQARGAAPPPP